MRFIRLGSVPSTLELVHRVFRFSDASDAKAVERAEAAILRANPRLNRLEEVSEDTLIAVPEVAGAEFSHGTSVLDSLADDLARQVRRGLNTARVCMENFARQEIANVETTLAVLNSPALTCLAEENDTVNERLPRIRQAAQSRLQHANNQLAVQ